MQNTKEKQKKSRSPGENHGKIRLNGYCNWLFLRRFFRKNLYISWNFDPSIHTTEKNAPPCSHGWKKTTPTRLSRFSYTAKSIAHPSKNVKKITSRWFKSWPFHPRSLEVTFSPFQSHQQNCQDQNTGVYLEIYAKANLTISSHGYNSQGLQGPQTDCITRGVAKRSTPEIRGGAFRLWKTREEGKTHPTLGIFFPEVNSPQ